MDYFLSFGWNALWVVLLVLWSSLTSLILFGALSCCKRLKRLDSAVPPLARNVANNNFMVELDEVVGKLFSFLFVSSFVTHYFFPS